MKYKSLGAAALVTAAVLGSTAMTRAADVGIMSTLDICSDLGLSGLTISSDDTCLVITGEVSASFTYGDLDDEHIIIDNLAYTDDTRTIDVGDGTAEAEAEVETEIQIEAVSATDFGPASGVIVLTSDLDVVEVDEAYIQIGDETVITMGMTDGIKNLGDDTAFTFQELFQEDAASGVGYNSDWGFDTSVATDGLVMTIEHEFGEGWSVAAGLEDLADEGSLVGVIAYDGDALSGHITVASDGLFNNTFGDDWGVHMAATYEVTDDAQLRGALAFNDEGWWNALLTGEATFDTFTLAAAADATVAGEYGLAGSLGIEMSDEVTLNMGSRIFFEANGDIVVDTGFEVEAEVGDNITLVAGGGYIYESDNPGSTYGSASLTWEPGGGVEAELAGEVSYHPGLPLGYEISTSLTKEIE